MKNTVISQSILNKVSEHYQAHLEKISDYLLPGPSVWWKKTPQGIMFLDGNNEDDHHSEEDTLQHFRSMSLGDLEIYLQQQWEACCSSKVELPATCIRYYGQDGILENISVSSSSSNQMRDTTQCI